MRSNATIWACNIDFVRKNADAPEWQHPALLNIAYKEKMLRENINDFLEKFEWKEVKKEYFTLDEAKQLAATPCRVPVLKQASFFACMTGLRICDIIQLKWSDFEMGPDQGYYIRICTEKTEREATLPIGHEALLRTNLIYLKQKKICIIRQWNDADCQ